jgi:hypothetical protein
MQVDQRGAGAAVAHAFHQLPEVGTRRSGQVIAGVAKIMEVNAGEPGSGAGPVPDPAAEVAVMQRRTRGTGEGSASLDP